MTDVEKQAYRYLLYWAMLDIRPVAWVSIRWTRAWNPLYLRRELRRIRYAGALADAFHNLAFFAATDFERFDPDWFWRDLESVSKRFPEFEPSKSYRDRFQRRCEEPKDP
jgi:hypothetical protein